MNDGINDYELGHLTMNPYGYSYSTFSTNSILTSIAKVNNAKIYFKTVYIAPTVDVIYAYLMVEYSTTDDPVIGQQTDDYFIVDMASVYDDVTAILIECRNNPVMYARNYKIQYAIISDCCNEAEQESFWNDFTPAVAIFNNEARDILHSWEPEDDVHCIRIKLTMSDNNAWEISQIYVWQADEYKYRLMDEGD